MQSLIILDFDGVLFDSAYEAHKVCELTAKKYEEYDSVSYEEFMRFRACLTDAWQFNRLYNRQFQISDYSKLYELTALDEDIKFVERFFASRAEMMKDEKWPELMAPYEIFFDAAQLIKKHPSKFKILSTRNYDSINRTLTYYGVDSIDIFGQEEIRKHGSKLNVAKHEGWIGNEMNTLYVDDMRSHLEPFNGLVDRCLHAGWGYDKSDNGLSQSEVLNILNDTVN